MKRIYVRGLGAVSPAGWGLQAFRSALEAEGPLPERDLARPGWTWPLRVRQVPPPSPKPAFLANPRLRRSSPISQYAVASALEALGDDAAKAGDESLRLGIILCVMSGCVNYSKRFYDEVLRDPATASPLVFPETVFNAPSSHLAALLGTKAINYTLVGDPGTFVQGLALAAEWLSNEMVDGCLVIGAEEMDWLTADAFRMFSRQLVLSDGAGAIYFGLEPIEGVPVELKSVTDAHLFTDRSSRYAAVRSTAAQLRTHEPAGLLSDGQLGVPRLDFAEDEVWRGWSGRRVSPKRILGEGLMAGVAWQCVAAADALMRGVAAEAVVNVVGCNQQVIGAKFARSV